MKKINILVTGSGSMIGYGAVKLISKYKFVNKVFAGNVNLDFPGRIYTENIVVYPDFYFKKEESADNFIDYILNFCEENNISAIIPCSIFELELFAINIKKFAHINVKVFVEEKQTIDTFFNKLKTAEYVKNRLKNGYLHTGELTDINIIPEINYPYIIKPKYGYGSQGVRLITNENDFRDFQQTKSGKFSSYIFQEFVDDNRGEYSCSVLYDSSNNPYTACAIRRELKNGDTVMAIYDKKCRKIEEQILSIASKFKGKFCLNFQFRFRDNEPCIFEINPRFAASEAIRAIFGQDPYFQLLSQYYFNEGKDKKRKYGKVVRVYEEILLP